jgi:hypothetical protein
MDVLAACRWSTWPTGLVTEALGIPPWAHPVSLNIRRVRDYSQPRSCASESRTFCASGSTA